jgi:hypothetical protein
MAHMLHIIYLLSIDHVTGSMAIFGGAMGDITLVISFVIRLHMWIVKLRSKKTTQLHL